MDLAEGLVSKQTDSQPMPRVDVHAQSPSWKAGRQIRSSSAKYLEKRSLGEPEYPDEEVGMTTGIFQKAEKLQDLLFLCICSICQAPEQRLGPLRRSSRLNG